MSIKLNQESSFAQVSFLDDQGADFREVFEPSMTSVIGAFLPFGEIVAPGRSLQTAFNEMANAGRTRSRPYAVTIQYAFIPNARILSSGAVSGMNRSAAMQGQVPQNAATAIRGFVVRFGNSDHHLLGAGIHLLGMPDFPGQRRSTREAPITWQDNETEDPIQWFVDYSVLN